MRRARALVWGGLVLSVVLMAAQGVAREVGPDAAIPTHRSAGERTPLSDLPVPPAAVVSSMNQARGVPNFLWAAPDQPLPPPAVRAVPAQAAQWYLTQHALRYRLSREALETLEVRHVHDTGRGGILVILGQRVEGIPVLPGTMRILLRRDGSLVAISGQLHPAAVSGSLDQRMPFDLLEEEALSRALEELTGLSLSEGDWQPLDRMKGDYRYFDLEPGALAAEGLRLASDARIRPVLYPMGEALTSAYYLELFLTHPRTRETVGYAFVVGARDGRLLAVRDLRDDAAFSYRVWGAQSGEMVPDAGPHEDWHPHPTGVNDGTYPAFTDAPVLTIEGFNTNPQGGNDPWLAADATTTTGNNVDAYADLISPDGYSDGDIRNELSDAGTFDWVYDTELDAAGSDEQVRAAITQLFYLNNWLHDWYYDSGFNEGAGVAQTDYFGRAGLEGDALRAEAEDGALEGSRNNANMSTPADGESPRMQMYLWYSDDSSVTIAPLVGALSTGTASFGPQEFNVEGRLILANDLSPDVNDGCSSLFGNYANRVVLFDRGECTFEQKVANAEAAGAIGAVIANNNPGEGPMGMAATDEVDDPTIPALSISYEDGLTVKGALNIGIQTAVLFREKTFSHSGAIDNTVSSHEWGHYIHHRLIQSLYNTQGRAMGEGWSDFIAMHTIYEEGDALDGTYAAGIYAMGSVFDEAGYYGIRRAPYSTDFSKNALSFRHIQNGEALPADINDILDFGDNSEVHNAGEVWCAMMWEAYMGIMEQSTGDAPTRTYAQVRRAMSDYLVAGMMMAPDDPTYTEQRDSLLAVAAAADSTDALLMTRAFARRGAGSCAQSPDRYSTDLIGVTESFEVAAEPRLLSMRLEEGSSTCDGDGLLDAGEDGFLVIEVSNAGTNALTDAVLTISADNELLVFSSGQSQDVERVAAYDTVSVRFPVTLEAEITGILDVAISARLESASSCVTEVILEGAVRGNVDNIPESASTDDVESEDVVWSTDASFGPAGIWNRLEESVSNHVFHGDDIGGWSDVSLVSPELPVGAGDFIVAFDHRHSFEASEYNDTMAYWDGAVIELSTDGETWEDVSTWADPGYNAVLYYDAESDYGSSLGGRDGFGGQNPSWPEMDTVQLNFGQAFVGQTVWIRFRVASDASADAEGWDLDNLAFTALNSTPFSSVVEDRAELTTYFEDTDGDGFGIEESTTQSCAVPSGYSQVSTDCDDTRSDVSPGGTEVCDEADNDCNGQVDDAPTDGTPYYADGDGDGQGAGDPVLSCTALEGYVLNAMDCDDGQPGIYSGASEYCNGLDNDCDGMVDEGAVDATLWYLDQDGDGYGSSSVEASCTQPEGYAAFAGDCDDADVALNPEAIEYCDGIDNNCNGAVDDSPADGAAYFPDLDGDGYGDPSLSLIACSQPEGFVADDSDCMDTNPEVNPEGEEICDEVDNNCDGVVDNDTSDGITYYADVDADGYGDPDNAIVSCTELEGHSLNGEDCDDLDANKNPAEEEVCDQKDNDCDGEVDDGAADGVTYYSDQDTDGYGASENSLVACSQPEGYVLDNTDCDDRAIYAHPGATEVCDGADDNCDGAVDNDAVDAQTAYADNDGDGYGAGEAIEVCTIGNGSAATGDDCNDADASTNPGSGESELDGVDHNCDGVLEDGTTPEDEGSIEGSGCACSDIPANGGGSSPLPAGHLLAFLGAGVFILRRRGFGSH